LDAYHFQTLLHTAFHKVFGASSGNLLVPTLHAICRSTHHLAVAADVQGQTTNSHPKVQHAVSLLQESFSRTFNDRTEFRPSLHYTSEGSKKAGVLCIVNELFAMYFVLNTLRLCKNLLRPVESRNLHQNQRMGDMVTYKYYVGRLALFEDQYAMAEEHLTYAFQHCHRHAKHNQKCILQYLVPVKLYRGKLPTPQCTVNEPMMRVR